MQTLTLSFIPSLLRQLFCAFLLLTALAQNASSEPPNIVYILADDMGYGDVAYLNEGSQIPTPNIDSLGENGIVFTDAHSGSALCTPTRYGILTGRYAWRTHLKKGVIWGWSAPLIKADRMTVASMLKEKGYSTGAVGKWHLGWDWPLAKKNVDVEDKSLSADNFDFSKPITNGPTARGFDTFFGIPASLDMQPYSYIENNHVTAAPDEIIDDWVYRGKAHWKKGAISPDFKHVEVLSKLTEKATGFIDRQSANKPFFLYFPLTAPHIPFVPEDRFKGKSGLNIWGDFVMQIDWTVGKVLQALERKGFEENTLVIFASDNGATTDADFQFLGHFGHYPSYVFRGGKGDIYEGGHRIPFLAKWPAKIKSGTRSDQTICLTDLMATAAEIVDYALPDDAGEDSVSLLPALLGQDKSALREATVHHSQDGTFSIRKGVWKLVLGPGSGGRSYPVDGHKDEIAGFPPLQLFNIEEDIGERTNLYEKHPEKVRELTELLQRYVDTGRSTPGAKQKNEGRTPITKK